VGRAESNGVRMIAARPVLYESSCIYKNYKPCRAGTLVTILRELSKYKLDLVGVQKVRWEGSGTKRAGECTFFYGKSNENHVLCAIFLWCVTERYEQLGRSSLLVIGCHWCHCSECSCPNKGKN
jgi:hypothetical protein